MLLSLALLVLPQQKLNLPLPTGGDVALFEWASDGRSVLYLADEAADNETELFQVRLPDLEHLRVSDPIAPPPGGSTSIHSSDGRACLPEPGSSRVVYSRTTIHDPFSYSDGYVVKVPGEEYGEVGLDSGGFGLVFAKGGRVAYGKVPTPGFHAVYSAPSDGSGPRVKLSPGSIGTNGGFRPTADGSRLILSFKVISGPWGLYSAPMDGSSPAVLLSSSANPQRLTGAFAPAPVGDRVVYVADDEVDEVFELWSVPADGSAAPLRLHMPLGASQDVQGFSFTPDGSRVVFGGNIAAPGPVELWVVSVTGGSPQKLSGSGSPRILPSGPPYLVTPDEERVLFLGEYEGIPVRRLFSVPLDGSAEPVALDPTGFGIAASPQLTDLGRRVVFTLDVTSLWIAPVDGATPALRLTPPMVSGGRIFTFSSAPGGRHVFYRADQDTDEVFELYRVPTDGSQVATRCNGPLVPGGDVQTWAMSPSGSSVAYLADQDADEVVELYWREYADGQRPEKAAVAPSPLQPRPH